MPKRPKKPIQTRVSRTNGGWVLEEIYVPKGKFKKGAMLSTVTGERSTFVSQKPRPDVWLIIGCLPRNYDAKRRICRSTTLHKKVTKISAKRAAALKKKRGVTVSRNPCPLLRGVPKVSKCMLAMNNPKISSRTVKAANPFLAVINPKKIDRAYKRFHFKKPLEYRKISVPNNFPSSLMTIGELERLDVQGSNGNIVSRKYTGRRPVLATGASMKDLYVIGGKALGIPRGNALRCDYRVPAHSGRNKWARRWWHAHDTRPAVYPANGGRAVRISGPGLKVTPRGIEG